jgi:hypothetical protein
MTIPAAVALSLVCLTCIIAGATVIIIVVNMRSSQISRNEEHAPAPVPWWERIPGHWHDSA